MINDCVGVLPGFRYAGIRATISDESTIETKSGSALVYLHYCELNYPRGHKQRAHPTRAGSDKTDFKAAKELAVAANMPA